MEGKHPEAEETLKPYSPEEGPPLPKGIFPPWPKEKGNESLNEETLKPYSPEEGPPLPKGIFPPWPTNFWGEKRHK